MPEKKRISPLVVGIAVALGVIGVWISWGWLVGPRLLPELVDRGLFGDAFGALNTLFAGLAFAGVIAALVLQSRELALQRRELRLQREEMELNRRELAKQGDLLRARAALEAKEVTTRAQPLLVFAGGSGKGSSGTYTLKVRNEGATVTNVEIDSPTEGATARAASRAQVWKTDEVFEIALDWADTKSAPTIGIRISYDDALGERQELFFEDQPIGHQRFLPVIGQDSGDENR